MTLYKSGASSKLMSQDLVEILKKMYPSGANGFEGLIAQLLSSMTGQNFLLAQSGSQQGRDISSHDRFSNITAIECKRYDQKTPLNERELLGELTQVAQDIPDLDLWVLVTTREISSQLDESLRKTATIYGIDYVSISTNDGSPSSLEVLCAFSPEIVINHSGVKNQEDRDRLKISLDEIKTVSDFSQKVAKLKKGLLSPLIGYENWRTAQNNWLINCLKSESETRGAFGQPINVDDSNVTLIQRGDAMTSLDNWFANWKTTNSVFTVLGEEGDGKTWGVGAWLSQNLKNTKEFPAILFCSSTDLTENDPVSLITNSISARLPEFSIDQARKRLSRWLTRPSGELPLFLLVLDGINERHSREWWRTLFERLRSSIDNSQVEDKPWYKEIAIIVTSRTSFWKSYFEDLKFLSFSTFTIQPYNEAELETALGKFNRSPESIPNSLLPLIKKPRFLDLMVKFGDRLADSGDITVARLIYEDWRDRIQRKRNITLTDTEFQDFIATLAAEHLERNQQFSRQVIDNTLVGISDQSEIFEELRTGGIIIPLNRGSFKVNEHLLKYGLGLLLVDQLEAITDNNPDYKEIIANWLEPHAEIDLKAAICEFAALHALNLSNLPVAAKVALLLAWVNSRNLEDGVERGFVAYLTLDPLAYIGLAEELFSNLTYNPWANDLLIHAFIEKYQNQKVKPLLKTAIERWLGYIYLYGSSFAKKTEEHIQAQREIEQRVGRQLQPGRFSYVGYQFTATINDRELLLGHRALGIISHLPRRDFFQAISIGCLAEAIMNKPEMYNLFAWVILSSPIPVWPEIKTEVEKLFSLNTVVTKQAAYRILSFVGNEEAFELQEKFPEDLFPPNELVEYHKKDPCTSFFSWSEEDCVTCLEREDLDITNIVRKIRQYCIEPGFEIPDRVKIQLRVIPEAIDYNSLWLSTAQTTTDATLETYEPALAVFAPHELANLIRLATREIKERQGLPLRQQSYHLIKHHLIFTDKEKLAVIQAWEKLLEARKAGEHIDEATDWFLFKLVLRAVEPREQLSYLLGRPMNVEMDSQDYEECFLQIDDWEIIEQQFQEAFSRDARLRCLWYISANPENIPQSFLENWVLPFIHNSDSLIRAFALEIIYKSKDLNANKRVVLNNWRFSYENHEFENHWGSLILAEYGNQEAFSDLHSRLDPGYIGYAVKSRGLHAEEVQILLGNMQNHFEQAIYENSLLDNGTYSTDDFEIILVAKPTIISEWLGNAFATNPQVKHSVYIRKFFYTYLCLCLLEKDADSGIKLYLRLDELGAIVNIKNRDSGILEIEEVLFKAEPLDTVKEVWRQTLEECNTDSDLMRIVILAEAGKGKGWLWMYINDHLNSSVLIDRARSICLLAFSESEDARDLLLSLLQGV
ncbi:MAG: restriction endonuclease, partial [Candidatus Melainabacteria bacterium]|nr:restriction endonuclease [Candidatus Melainabacteria bacterium]